MTPVPWNPARLAAGARLGLGLALVLAPPVALGVVLQSLLGGSWLAYAGLLLAGLLLGARLERARRAGRAQLTSRLRRLGVFPRAGLSRGRGEDDGTRNQKYLM